jgi:hypothetical protein
MDIRSIKPNMRGLVNWASKNGIAANWKELALNLKLEQYHIDILMADNPLSARDQCRSMFSQWMQRTVGCSVGMLIDACFETGLEDAARDLMDKANFLFK